MCRIIIYAATFATISSAFGAFATDSAAGAAAGALLGFFMGIIAAAVVNQTGVLDGPLFTSDYGLLFDSFWWVFDRTFLFFLPASTSERFRGYVKTKLISYLRE